MPYQLTGILKLPDGTPAANVDIEFVSQANYSPLVRDLSNTIRTSSTGSYSVVLEYGEYAIRLLYASSYPLHPGKIYVYADTPAGQDLPALMQAANFTPATPDYVVQIQNWLVEAKAARDAAAASAAAAKASENAVAGSITQHEAKAGAHPISGVTGLQSALNAKLDATATAAAATKLATARTITVGKTSKSFDGSANQSWSVGEIAGLVASAISDGSIGAFSHRNLLINGGFQVAQRGAIDKTFENSSEWVADRWRLFTNGPLYVRAFGVAGDGVGDTLGITGQNGATVNSFEISQKIESYTSIGHVNSPLTVSFEWYCTTGHNINIKLNKPAAGIDNWSTYTAALPSQTITVNSGTSNVSVTFADVGDIRNGLSLIITVSNMQPSCIFKIRKVQLERGPVATPFEHRPYGYELILCRRYYHKFSGLVWLSMPTQSDGSLKGNYSFPVEMRAAPTVSNLVKSNASYAVTVESIGTKSLVFSASSAGYNNVTAFEASAEL